VRLNACGAGTIALREVASWIPGCDLSGLPAGLPLERYEASIVRLMSLRKVTATRDAVRAFVGECLRKRADAAHGANPTKHGTPG
jgi:hypothetical protein